MSGEWPTGSADPVERWIEVRGYWRERARQAATADEIEQCRSHFEFAEGMLATARSDSQGATRVLALEAVSRAIGTRRLSSVSELAARSDDALGVFGDPRLVDRIDADLRGPLMALLGNLPALFKSLLVNDGDGLEAALRQSAAAGAGVRDALDSLSGAGDAVRAKRRHIAKSAEGGMGSAVVRKGAWNKRSSEIFAEYSRDPRQLNKTIALTLGCKESQVTKALKERGISRRSNSSPKAAR